MKTILYTASLAFPIVGKKIKTLSLKSLPKTSVVLGKGTSRVALRSRSTPDQLLGRATSKSPSPCGIRVSRPKNKSATITSILTNFGFISTAFSYLVKIFGPKSKYFFLFSFGLLFFRKSWKIYLTISGLFIALMAIVSYFSGENLNLSMLTIFQVLAYPFIWLSRKGFELF